jgi:secreted Zn-dependent insulinase-like peptidase
VHPEFCGFIFVHLTKWHIAFQAAAAMCVGMGSFADPPKAQGLAHFLGMKCLFFLLNSSYV